VPENVDVLLDSSGVLVRASCDVPFGVDSVAIRRLEIPYGYFERRIPLPTSTFDVVQRELVNGCLILTLRKVL
jgi:HSP20 family protein